MRALRTAQLLRRWLMRDGTSALERVRAAERHEEFDINRRVQVEEGLLLPQRHRPTVHVGIGTSGNGQPAPIVMDEAEVRGGGHWLVTGATGSGKSFAVLSILMQLIARRPKNIVIIDMKGELAELVRTIALPSLIATLLDEQARAIVASTAVIAPFDRDATPPFQVLTRDPSLAVELQATEVATSFGNTVGRDLGVLQGTILKYALMLAIDVGLTLEDLPRILQDDDLRRGAVERTRLEEVRAYFAGRFPRERPGSVASLLSRLDTLLMHETLRRMLRSRGMVRFDRLLERGITIISLGGSPAGMGEVGKFFGQLLFRKLVRAIFARRVQPNTLPVTIVADEFQAMLAPDIGSDFERVLTLARSQRCFLWCLFQQAAQVEAVSPTLLRLLRTNTNYQLMGRSDIADARALSHILPVTGRVPRVQRGFPDPRNPPQFLTIDDERRRLVEQVPSMPDRLFWFWNRRSQQDAVLMRSATLRMDRMRARANSLPPELRSAISRGVLAADEQAVVVTGRERERFRRELAGDTGGETNDNADSADVDSDASAPAPPDPEPVVPPPAQRRARTTRRRGGPNLG